MLATLLFSPLVSSANRIMEEHPIPSLLRERGVDTDLKPGDSTRIINGKEVRVFIL